MERPYAKKEDWKTFPMPAVHKCFTLKRHFEPEEIQNLRYGNIPQEMEDKWFWYMEGDVLYAHRSWSGYCIYIVSFDFMHDKARVQVNSKDYKASLSEAKSNLNYLLDYWVLTPYDYYDEWLGETLEALHRTENE